MREVPHARPDSEPPPHRRRVRNASSIGLNLTSMIDVVFLLLVYFLVATDFTQSEEIYRLDLPERTDGLTLDPFELDDEPVRIIVHGTGGVDGDYRLQIDGPGAEAISSFESLYDYLAARRLDGMGGGLFAEDHPLLVVPSSRTSWSHAVSAFNAAVRAGYVNITFEESAS
jgi:biopolymer transport protein ExbD